MRWLLGCACWFARVCGWQYNTIGDEGATRLAESLTADSTVTSSNLESEYWAGCLAVHAGLTVYVGGKTMELEMKVPPGLQSRWQPIAL